MKPNLIETRNTLLLRLQDPRDMVAWDEFVEIYEPLIIGLAKSKGFQDADAADLCQEVLLAVSKAIDRWDPDPAKGRFRDWLYRIARNLILNFVTRSKHRSLATLEWDFSRVGDSHESATLDGDLTDSFDLAYQRALFRFAAEKVKREIQEKSWLAFQRSAVEQIPLVEVAAELGMTAGAVKVAKCRVLAKIRSVLADRDVSEAVRLGVLDR